MSQSSIQAFRQELKKNKALRTKVQAIDRRDKAAALKQLVGVASAAGGPFAPPIRRPSSCDAARHGTVRPMTAIATTSPLLT